MSLSCYHACLSHKWETSHCTHRSNEGKEELVVEVSPRYAQREHDLQTLKQDLKTQIIEQRIYKKEDLEDFFELVQRLEKWNESGVQRIMQELREEFYMDVDD